MAAHALLAILALLLLIAAVTDLKARIIANRLNLAIALLAPAYWWASGLSPWPDMALQAALGVAVFAVFAGLFAMGWMGGGDVKLLGALALWLPLVPLMRMLFAMSLLGGVLTLIVVAVHRLRRVKTSPEVPYGVAIASAGLWVIGELYLNQFA
ncbi:peptidase [Sphingomonas sp. MAH-20]|uniref:Peptidase n=1 Tax=Sphingomonas horti TaxID=2682842 RepID=A0A6I4IZ39_9SPHN|nr:MULTISPECIES: prepilin peptidase [Sphingomonas]MBA2918184.1 prepilin peptidase [Sphingomonas sp. CGMCC 1.13658]MVO77153.1 peptidase [Sphingomonas horti]